MKIEGELYEGEFLERLNRFTVLVNYNNRKLTCHLHDPGRLRELLIPNRRILFKKVSHDKRKTEYDVIAVKSNGYWVIVDSRMPNLILKKMIEKSILKFEIIEENIRCGKSIIDFLLRKDDVKYIVEVKGCTLCENGIALFPDAPTLRGSRQLLDMMNCNAKPMIIFIIMRKDAHSISINYNMDRKFYEAIKLGIMKNLIIRAFKVALEESVIYFEGDVKFFIE
ncbi:MAG: DNA/RNA nuclease SfsA [Candidatus Methanomethyliaceae archaeon]|nr:DNA/RNA nuclease SfsA [Candidatus Methanomethyliaceae archaeon]MDW7970797.1 DNA/RNA nuclease SfsA [Nitrososphaerota archaeon]